MKVSRVFAIDQQPGTHEIAENEWATAKRTAIITRGVSTCALIAVHNASRQTGYLGHFETVGLKNNPAFKIFCDNLEARESGENLAVWMGGISRLSSERDDPETVSTYHQETAHDKTDVLLALGAISSRASMDWKWLEVDQHITVAQLDVPKGEFQYVVQQLPKS